jgi:transcriptional regulator with XRE-family HTH domain
MSIRSLAQRIGVSPSLVSQIETGKVNPSVGTLVALTTELELSLDVLFADVVPPPAPGDGATAGTPVLRPAERPALELETGVTWYRLTPRHEEDVDFLYVVYGVGGESCPPDAMMVHRGREYGLVLSGRIGATVGFESYELGPGDSIVFEARSPHRFWTIGPEPAVVVWTIIGRAGETRNAFG